MRVGMTKEQVEAFGKKKPKAQPAVAKKKRRTEIKEEPIPQKIEVKQAEVQEDSRVSGGALRGVVSETMARVYEEMFPRMTVRDEYGNVDLEISEETYILVLTMLVGEEVNKPRRALKIRESEISEKARYCKEHA